MVTIKKIFKVMTGSVILLIGRITSKVESSIMSDLKYFEHNK